MCKNYRLIWMVILMMVILLFSGCQTTGKITERTIEIAKSGINSQTTEEIERLRKQLHGIWVATENPMSVYEFRDDGIVIRFGYSVWEDAPGGVLGNYTLSSDHISITYERQPGRLISQIQFLKYSITDSTLSLQLYNSSRRLGSNRVDVSLGSVTTYHQGTNILQQIHTAWERAQEADEDNDFEVAVEAYTELLSLGEGIRNAPYLTQARERLSVVSENLEMEQDLPAAIARAEQDLRANSGNLEIRRRIHRLYVRQAEIYRDNNDLANAVEWYRRSLDDLNLASTSVRLLMGDMYRELGNLTNSLASYRRAIQTVPEPGTYPRRQERLDVIAHNERVHQSISDVLIRQGNEHANRGDYANALALYKEAIMDVTPEQLSRNMAAEERMADSQRRSINNRAFDSISNIYLRQGRENNDFRSVIAMAREDVRRFSELSRPRNVLSTIWDEYVRLNSQPLPAFINGTYEHVVPAHREQYWERVPVERTRSVPRPGGGVYDQQRYTEYVNEYRYRDIPERRYQVNFNGNRIVGSGYGDSRFTFDEVFFYSGGTTLELMDGRTITISGSNLTRDGTVYTLVRQR